MPHRAAAINNAAAMLGFTVTDAAAAARALEGMGFGFLPAETPEEAAAEAQPQIGMYVKATDADLRDYQIEVNSGFTAHDISLIEVNEKLQNLGFTIARMK
jgi:hypothetical protein